jgi:hypothetical protein
LFSRFIRDLRSACDSRSTPFLNIHWYENVALGRALRLMGGELHTRMLDKTEQTGSPLQFVNGLILMITFAGARLVYGSIIVRTPLEGGTLSIISRTGCSTVLAVLPNDVRGAGRAHGG